MKHLRKFNPTEMLCHLNDGRFSADPAILHKIMSKYVNFMQTCSMFISFDFNWLVCCKVSLSARSCRVISYSFTVQITSCTLLSPCAENVTIWCKLKNTCIPTGRPIITCHISFWTPPPPNSNPLYGPGIVQYAVVLHPLFNFIILIYFETFYI